MGIARTRTSARVVYTGVPSRLSSKDGDEMGRARIMWVARAPSLVQIEAVHDCGHCLVVGEEVLSSNPGPRRRPSYRKLPEDDGGGYFGAEYRSLLSCKRRAVGYRSSGRHRLDTPGGRRDASALYPILIGLRGYAGEYARQIVYLLLPFCSTTRAQDPSDVPSQLSGSRDHVSNASVKSQLRLWIAKCTADVQPSVPAYPNQDVEIRGDGLVYPSQGRTNRC